MLMVVVISICGYTLWRLATPDASDDFRAAIAPLIAAIGLSSVAFCVVLVRSYQRALDDAVRQDAAGATSVSPTELKFRALLDNMSDVILVIDETGILRYLSPAAERYTPGLKAGENVGKVVHPDDRSAARDMVIESFERPAAKVSRELRVLCADGSYRNFDVDCANRISDPTIRGFVLTSHDMTDRKAFEERLKNLAFLDPLTGLANRAYFLDQLDRALAQSAQDSQPVALMFLDLDNFKLVNDTLGHEAGDRLLVVVAHRLRDCIRSGDVAARLGGDEFTMLFRGVPDTADAERLAKRVAEELREPIDLGSRSIVVTTSVGIAVGAPGADSPTDLLRHADLAMYRAKLSGASQYSVFDPSMKIAAA
jgi:diguanylate cyclase (GGDEF)-like protein/PAS domain S-box-containing protein